MRLSKEVPASGHTLISFHSIKQGQLIKVLNDSDTILVIGKKKKLEREVNRYFVVNSNTY